MVKMHLDNESFCLIHDGYKIIESRVNDEKRRALRIGDTIEFENRKTNEIVTAQIIDLIYKKTFTELFDDCDPADFGDKNKRDLLELIYSLYAKDEEEKYGVVGIKIKVLK